MRTLALALLALLLPLQTVSADVWRDPTLAEALARAELVIRARARETGSSLKPTIKFAVDTVLKGRPLSTRVEVGGFHDATRMKAPSFIKTNDEMYLILIRRKGTLELPTPTFGRFRVRDGKVRFVALRDTYLRLNMTPADFEAFVRLHFKRVDRKWLAGLRAHLAKTGPDTKGEARTRQYLALEALALVGEASDAKTAARYTDVRFPYQMRISACRALAKVAGARSAGRLLRVARDDPTAAVRIVAIRMLDRLSPPPPGLVKKLAALLPKASVGPFRLSHGPNDPRTNTWASPKENLLRVIARHGAGPAKADLLKVLDEPKVTLQVFAACLRSLLTLKDDADLPKQLVKRFRAQGTVGSVLFNRELCVALTKLTKQPFKEDVARWKTWAASR